MKRQVSAFTLSEILVTLAVIGIIVSITIPSLMQDIQDSQLKTAWKKAFVDLSQATKRLISDNGGSLKGLCEDGDKNCFRNKYMPYLNYINVCDANSLLGNCWNKNGAYSLNRTPYMDADWWNKMAGLVLNNGSFLVFQIDSKNCSTPTGNLYRCGWLTTDVNGHNGPNTVGRDIFRAWVFDESLRPFGIDGDGRPGGCDISSTGDKCSAVYLYK